MRQVALVARPYKGRPSIHSVGLPSLEPGEPETRGRAAVARVVVLSHRPDGIFLERFDESGTQVGDTWHRSFNEAMEQAVSEYGESLGDWSAVPPSEPNPVAFALRLPRGAA